MTESLRDLLQQRASDGGGATRDLAAGALKRSKAIGRRRFAVGLTGAVAGLALAGMVVAVLALPADRQPAPPVDDPTVTETASPDLTDEPADPITTKTPQETSSDESDAEGEGEETEPAATAETSSPVSGDSDIDPRLEVIVGTWEAAYEDVGPHGSALTIRRDGTATLSSFANQHGSYEGEIHLGSKDPHYFEGVESETGDEITVEFSFDAEADTLTLVYPEGGSYVHTRA